MEYLSLSRRRERVGISSHCGSRSEAKWRRLERPQLRIIAKTISHDLLRRRAKY